MTSAKVIIPNILSFTPVKNSGISFSLLSGNQLLLIIATIILIAAVLVWIFTSAKSKLILFGLWSIAAGGLGNLWDRLVYGSVIDFIEPLFVRFAVFNIADILIFIGAVTVCADILFFMPKNEAEARERDDNNGGKHR